MCIKKKRKKSAFIIFFGSLLTLLLAFISIVDTMIQVISYNIAKGSLNR